MLHSIWLYDKVISYHDHPIYATLSLSNTKLYHALNSSVAYTTMSTSGEIMSLTKLLTIVLLLARAVVEAQIPLVINTWNFVSATDAGECIRHDCMVATHSVRTCARSM